MSSERPVDLSVSIGSLTLKNPVLTASGTFGYALEYDAYFDVAELGGICTKGLSVEPRFGNAPARIWETGAGMLNAIGLANVGVEAFCVDKLPKLRERGVKPVRREGAREGRWVLLDFVDVVVHVQHNEERGFYGLERLWKDCPAIPLPEVDPSWLGAT